MWWRWLRHVFCRHADMLVIERGRMFMECDVCGRQTVGITVPDGGIHVRPTN